MTEEKFDEFIISAFNNVTSEEDLKLGMPPIALWDNFISVIKNSRNVFDYMKGIQTIKNEIEKLSQDKLDQLFKFIQKDDAYDEKDKQYFHTFLKLILEQSTSSTASTLTTVGVTKEFSQDNKQREIEQMPSATLNESSKNNLPKYPR